MKRKWIRIGFVSSRNLVLSGYFIRMWSTNILEQTLTFSGQCCLKLRNYVIKNGVRILRVRHIHSMFRPLTSFLIKTKQREAFLADLRYDPYLVRAANIQDSERALGIAEDWSDLDHFNDIMTL